MATRYYGFGKDDNGSEIFQIKILDDTDTQIGTVMSYNPSFSDNEFQSQRYLHLSINSSDQGNALFFDNEFQSQ